MSDASPIPPSSESQQIVELKKELQWAYLKIQVLEQRLRLQRIQKYGPASEKLSDAQLELAGTGTRGEQRRSRGGERARTSAGNGTQPETPPASGAAGTAGGVCRAWSA